MSLLLYSALKLYLSDVINHLLSFFSVYTFQPYNLPKPAFSYGQATFTNKKAEENKVTKGPMILLLLISTL